MTVPTETLVQNPLSPDNRGRRKGEEHRPPLDFEIFSKQGCFPSFEWKNQISPLLAHPWKNLGKIP